MSQDQKLVLTFRESNDSIELVCVSFEADGVTQTGLTSVFFSSSDTTVATVSGNLLSITGPGTTSITAFQPGDATYRPANVTKTLTIFLEKTEVSALPSYTAAPVAIQASTPNPDVLTLTVLVNNIEYTNVTGVAYGMNTGYAGVVVKLQITTRDQNNNIVSNHSSTPLQLSLDLPMANPTSPLFVYKLDGEEIMTVQPSGYPAELTFVSGVTWTGTLPSLSEFIILDTEPPTGFSGGDPYIRTVFGEVFLIPNDWKIVRLYEHEGVRVLARCQHLEDQKIMSNLRCVKESINTILPDIITEENTSLLNTRHWWVYAITYMVELMVFTGNTPCLRVDLMHGEILEDNKQFSTDWLSNDDGLFSIMHGRTWEKKDLKAFIVYLDEGNRLRVRVDNHWDDINNVELFLRDKEDTVGYIGEFFGHDGRNKIA